MSLKYMILKTNNAAFNLAAEEYVFEKLPKDCDYLMLWQNDNAVIVGKHQNTYSEINEKYVHENGITVVRRLSGGGAVYHDLGNLNYSIISDAKETGLLDIKLFCEPIISAIRTLGVNAEVTGRNDITIKGKKISGNSQYIKNGRILHHGTIMIKSDLDVLQNALAVDDTKIQAKGIKSVGSRVTNLSEHVTKEVSVEDVRKTILREILSNNLGSEYFFTENELLEIADISRNKYEKFEWNYGKSPECTILRRKRIDGCGTVEAYITLNKGIVEDIHFRGDFFSVDDPTKLSTLLIGCKLYKEDCEQALKNTDCSRFFVGITTKQLIEILLE